MYVFSLAWRYLTFKEQDSAIKFMTRICFLSIAIGTCALTLTLIITHGFERTIHEKMQGVNSDITISLPNNKLSYQEIRETLLKEYPSTIEAITGSSIKQAIIDYNKLNRVLFVKGIDYTQEALVTSLAEKIIKLHETDLSKTQGANRLKPLAAPYHLYLGDKCARDLGISVGDTIKLLIPEATGRTRIALTKKKCFIAGIFQVGLDEYDSSIGYLSLENFNTIFDEEGVDQLSVKLQGIYRKESFFSSLINSTTKSQQVISLLQQRLPHLEIKSWQELYPELVSSLKLEKYVMFFIIALITLVACMNMISLLFTMIQQKRPDIAIYKTMGMQQASIRKIFLLLGMTITTSATLFGLGVAAIIGYLLEYHSAIPLPDVYYVSHLPARMELELFIVVFLCCFILGFIATWIPAKRAQRLNITTVLRQE